MSQSVVFEWVRVNVPSSGNDMIIRTPSNVDPICNFLLVPQATVVLGSLN